MTARQYLALRLAALVDRYTGNPSGFDEPMVRAAEAAVDDAVRHGRSSLKATLDQYEQTLVLTEVVR